MRPYRDDGRVDKISTGLFFLHIFVYGRSKPLFDRTDVEAVPAAGCCSVCLLRIFFPSTKIPFKTKKSPKIRRIQAFGPSVIDNQSKR